MVQTVRNLPEVQETRVQSLHSEDPLEETMAAHSSILVGESHGQRRLADYSPRVARKELDTTEQLILSLHTVYYLLQYTRKYICYLVTKNITYFSDFEVV